MDIEEIKRVLWQEYEPSNKYKKNQLSDHLCDCGCGKRTKFNPHTGEPNPHINQHNWRGKKLTKQHKDNIRLGHTARHQYHCRECFDTNWLKECKGGCGKIIAERVEKDGHKRDYYKCHNSREWLRYGPPETRLPESRFETLELTNLS